MASLLKKGLVMRNLKNISHHFVNDELHGMRELGDAIHKIMPPLTCPKASMPHCLKILLPPAKLEQRPQTFRYVLNLKPNPTDSNDDNKTDSRTQREQEIEKLQNLRQRNIDHNFHKESVWKALEERDQVLGRKNDKSSKDENNNEEK